MREQNEEIHDSGAPSDDDMAKELKADVEGDDVDGWLNSSLSRPSASVDALSLDTMPEKRWGSTADVSQDVICLSFVGWMADASPWPPPWPPSVIQLLQIVCLVSLGVKPVGCFNGAKEGFYLISAGTIATCATVAVVCDEGPVDLRTTDKARQPSQRDIDRARSRIPGLSQWESSVRRNLARKRYLESIFRASSTDRCRNWVGGALWARAGERSSRGWEEQDSVSDRELLLDRNTERDSRGVSHVCFWPALLGFALEALFMSSKRSAS